MDHQLLWRLGSRSTPPCSIVAQCRTDRYGSAKQRETYGLKVVDNCSLLQACQKIHLGSPLPSCPSELWQSQQCICRKRERERRKKRLSPVLFLLLCVRFSLLLALCFSLLFRCPALLGFFLSLPRFLLLPSATDGGTTRNTRLRIGRTQGIAGHV